MATSPEDTTTDRPSTTPSRRRPRRTAPAAGGGGRGRGARPTGGDLVASLSEMVDRLIKENRDLKRAIANAEKSVVGAGLGQATRVLSGLQRRVSQALSSGAPAARGRRGRGAAAEPAPRPRRKVTDPEVLERRRQALAKARAARAAKRQAGGG